MNIDFKRRFSKAWSSTKPLLASRYFWLGLFGLLLFWIGVYLLVDKVIMPSYTRYGVQITVPDTRNLPLAEAEILLNESGLELAQVTQRYEPNKPRDVVLNQEPLPKTQVKPGRRVYLTVNNGQVPKVEVPDVQYVSLREAQSRIAAHRLAVGEVLEDTLPAAFKNTITRQLPAPGDSVVPGTIVDLWVSTGLGNETVQVPDITELSVREAEQVLARTRLRLVLLTDLSIEEAKADTVVRQQPPPGAEVPVGSEIRAFARQSDSDVPQD